MVLVQPPAEPVGTVTGSSPGAVSPPAPSAAEHPESRPSTPPDVVQPDSQPARKSRFREDFPLPAQPGPDSREHPIPIVGPPRRGGPATQHPPTPPADNPLAPQPTIWTRYQLWWLVGGAAAAGIALALLVVGILIARKPAATDPALRLAQQAELAPTDDSGVKGSPSEGTPAESVAPRGDVADTPTTSTKAADDPPRGTESQLADATTDGPTPEPSQPAEPRPDDAEPPEHETPAAVPDMGRAPPAEPASDSESDATASGTAADAALDLADRLTMVIPAIEFSQASVADFVHFVTELTTIPVTLDVDAILEAGLSTDTELEVQLRGVTVEQLLRAALEPHQLTYVLLAGYIVIGPASGDHAETVQEMYDVSDLASDESQLAALASHITTLIAPETWAGKSTEGDAGGAVPGSGRLTLVDQELDIEQAPAVHFHVRRFLDRLRTARGLLPRTGLLPSQTIWSPMFLQAREELERPVTLNLTTPTELARVLDYLRAETDLHWIVDWPDVTPLGWTPTALVPLSIDRQPLGTALDDWLNDLSLGYRMVDADTVQISSQAAIAARREVEVYPVTEGAVGQMESLMRDVRAYLGDEARAGGAGPGVILFDPLVPGLLAALPQPDQRRLAEYLIREGHLLVGSEAADDEP